jgi:coenzyme F420-reducing hydrogenase gamma subunit
VHNSTTSSPRPHREAQQISQSVQQDFRIVQRPPKKKAIEEAQEKVLEEEQEAQ